MIQYYAISVNVADEITNFPQKLRRTNQIPTDTVQRPHITTTIDITTYIDRTYSESTLKGVDKHPGVSEMLQKFRQKDYYPGIAGQV